MKAGAEATARGAVEKVVAEVAAKEKDEVEVALAAKAAEDAAKTSEVALTQGESPIADLAPLVIRTLEELQKEQQLVRSILDKQEQVNSSI